MSPPAGHVTVPAVHDAAGGYYAMAGFRAAGDRAIRIDMLERLADMLRDKDSRAGFEASPEMLSITGLSMDLFAQLMVGLGYKAEKAERPKVKAVKPMAVTAAPETPTEPTPDSGQGLAAQDPTTARIASAAALPHVNWIPAPPGSAATQVHP